MSTAQAIAQTGSTQNTASDTYKKNVRRSDLDVEKALQNYRNNIQNHSVILQKMANKDLNLPLTFQGPAGSKVQPEVFQPKIQNAFLQTKIGDIVSFAKKVQSFLNDYEERSLEECVAMVNALTLTGDTRLRKHDEHAIGVYMSLMGKRDLATDNPEVAKVKSQFVGKVAQAIMGSLQGLQAIYEEALTCLSDNDPSNGVQRGIYPFQDRDFDYSQLSTMLINIFDSSSGEYKKFQNQILGFRKEVRDKNKETPYGISGNNAFGKFYRSYGQSSSSGSRSYSGSFPYKAALRTIYEMLIGQGATTEAQAVQTEIQKGSNDQGIQAFLSSNQQTSIGKAYNTLMYLFQNSLPEIGDISQKFKMNYENLGTEFKKLTTDFMKQQASAIELGKQQDLPGTAVNPKGKHAQAVVKEALVTNELVKAAYYGVFTRETFQTLFLPSASESGVTPESSKGTVLGGKKEAIWTPYSDLGTLQDKWMNYRTHVLPLFQPCSPYEGYINASGQPGLVTISRGKTHAITYPFGGTNQGSAKDYAYNFRNPKKGYWVDPYTDSEHHHLNTVFWHIRYKYELIDALERFKATQQDTRAPSLIDKMFDPVIKVLQAKRIPDRIYNDLRKAGYGTPETFQTLTGTNFEDFCATYQVTGHDKSRLQEAVLDFTKTRQEITEEAGKAKEAKAAEFAKERGDMKDKGEATNLGGTLADFFFPKPKLTDTESGDPAAAVGDADKAQETVGDADKAQETVGDADKASDNASDNASDKATGDSDKTVLQQEVQGDQDIFRYLRGTLNHKRYASDRALDQRAYEILRSSSEQDKTLIQTLISQLEDKTTSDTLHEIQKGRTDQELLKEKQALLDMGLKYKEKEHTLLASQKKEATVQKDLLALRKHLEDVTDKHRKETRSQITKLQKEYEDKEQHMEAQERRSHREVAELRQQMEHLKMSNDIHDRDQRYDSSLSLSSAPSDVRDTQIPLYYEATSRNRKARTKKAKRAKGYAGSDNQNQTLSVKKPRPRRARKKTRKRAKKGFFDQTLKALKLT